GITRVSYTAPNTLVGGTIEDLTVFTPDPNIMSFCMGGVPFSGGGTDEVQTITVTGTPTGGTFTMTFSGQTTAAIPYSATMAQLAAALTALSNIEIGDITVTGGPLPATPLVVTFGLGQYGGIDVPTMTATASFTGGTTPTIAVAETTKGAAGAALGYAAPAVNVDPIPFGIGVEAWTNAITNNAVDPTLPYEQWVLPKAKLALSKAVSLEAANVGLPVFVGTCEQNPSFLTGPLKDITFPTSRVWQYCRVATIPTLTPGFYAVS
ncbi:MAG: hypothetical protein ACRDZY_10690, partial [Acidimicrobiales bacterium]